MFDPTSALVALNGVVGLLRQAAGLAKDIKAAELQDKLQEKLRELHEKIGFVQIAFNEQAIENSRLIAELRKATDIVRALEEKLKAKGERRQHGNAVWIRGNPNPLCMVCEAKGIDMPLRRHDHGFGCGNCKEWAGQCQPPPEFDIPPNRWPPPPGPPQWDYDPFRRR